MFKEGTDMTEMQEMEKEALIYDYKELIEEFYSEQEPPQDIKNLLLVFPSLIKLAYLKGKGYGRAYSKYGDLSIFFNLDRKYERIVNILMKRFNGIQDNTDLPTETFFDTLIDLAVYALLWVGYKRETNTSGWKEWVEKNLGKE